jgi:DNA processing protein
MRSMDDASPPPCLKEIYDPPLITRVRGNPEVLTTAGIAMVGTRHPTPTVLAWPSGWYAIWPPKDWSLLVVVMISSSDEWVGRGVDSASHRGAISAKGKTVAVFGTGVDVIYPQENSPLSEQILALGSALISEFPLGTFAPLQNFPIGNRIIRGMSVGVVVVEAAEYPPRASPAGCALEQNRDLFQVPGNVTNKNSWGPNTLIQPGAVLVATWEEVWEQRPTEL